MKQIFSIDLLQFYTYCDGVAKLPRPSSSTQRASQPAPDFMIYFI